MNKLPREVIKSLSTNIREKIERISREDIRITGNFEIEEIRLRANKPLILNANNTDYFFNKDTEG